VVIYVPGFKFLDTLCQTTIATEIFATKCFIDTVNNLIWVEIDQSLNYDGTTLKNLVISTVNKTV
jgi:hypothetical protein